MYDSHITMLYAAQYYHYARVNESVREINVTEFGASGSKNTAVISNGTREKRNFSSDVFGNYAAMQTR